MSKTTKEKIEETQLQLEKLKQDLAALKEQEKEEKRQENMPTIIRSVGAAEGLSRESSHVMVTSVLFRVARRLIGRARGPRLT